MRRASQTQLDFGSSKSQEADGLLIWREQQRKQLVELSKELGLPLGKEVQVWLVGGIRLQGVLELDEAALIYAQITAQNGRFRVGGVSFRFPEMESCTLLQP